MKNGLRTSKRRSTRKEENRDKRFGLRQFFLPVAHPYTLELASVHPAQSFWKIVSKVSFEIFAELFVFHDSLEAACALLVRSVNGKGVHFESVTLQTAYIVRHDRFKYSVLIFRLLPLTVWYMQFSGVCPGRLGHDLVTSVGTAFTVVRMIIARSALYFDHFFDDLLHRSRFQSCCLCQFGIGVGGSGGDEECHDNGKESVGNEFF